MTTWRLTLPTSDVPTDAQTWAPTSSATRGHSGEGIGEGGGPSARYRGGALSGSFMQWVHPTRPSKSAHLETLENGLQIGLCKRRAAHLRSGVRRQGGVRRGRGEGDDARASRMCLSHAAWVVRRSPAWRGRRLETRHWRRLQQRGLQTRRSDQPERCRWLE
eukprot:scaffold190503_cov26-Tisochrysis_lutea.AAC.5